ncbi:MAG: circularly permuted type 2 ATP-grasp protein [Arcobacteraceae bacterium]|nr:circularly permuted type 2 ATP-grasp protein [Arcobacteraceae bacterium]MDY0328092.1 circularly permuted type 2 ATP-grasp protein [Arcobacteraceae bacterium]
MVQNSEEFDRFLNIFNQLNKSKFEQLQSFMDDFAINFNLFKDGSFLERSFPFDMIPRIIPKNEFELVEKGLKQRVHALNEFLNDIYGDQKIIKDGIIPAEFIFSSKAYNPAFHGQKVSKNIRTHICGIDLVQNSVNNKWTILEDNLRVPSGASYPLSIRQAYRKVYPEIFEQMKVEKIRYYPNKLKEMMDYVSTGGINIVLTPGRYNSAFYEHAYLAKQTGSTLAISSDLEVMGDKLYLKGYNGKKIQVGAIYRRLDDDFLDPLEFDPKSLIGVPGLINVYRSGNVAIINSVGNGIADDKGIYYFVPQMIKYYLGEDAILDNAPTYLPYFPKDLEYVLANMDKLVIKDVAEAGGYGVLFGYKMTKTEIEDLKKIIIEQPRRFIAQELIEFYDIDCLFDGKLTPRKSDLRCYVVYGEEIYVWPGGLTRYALEEGNYLVNSSQGGGFKDTWVMG